MSTPVSELPDGYWWCPNCRCEVSPSHVTYHCEWHDVCNTPVEWVSYTPDGCEHCSAKTVTIVNTALGNVLVCRTCGAVDREVS